MGGAAIVGDLTEEAEETGCSEVSFGKSNLASKVVVLPREFALCRRAAA
jgi:hypothetical protein